MGQSILKLKSNEREKGRHATALVIYPLICGGESEKRAANVIYPFLHGNE